MYLSTGGGTLVSPVMSGSVSVTGTGGRAIITSINIQGGRVARDYPTRNNRNTSEIHLMSNRKFIITAGWRRSPEGLDLSDSSLSLYVDSTSLQGYFQS